MKKSYHLNKYKKIGLFVVVFSSFLVPFIENFIINTNATPSITVSIDDIIEVTGNNNGNIDAGESIKLRLKINNTGTVNLTNVYGFLNISSPYISLKESSRNQSYVSIETGSTRISASYYEFTVNSSTPTNTNLNFSLIVRSDQQNFIIPFILKSYSRSSVEFLRYEVISETNGDLTTNNNLIMDPGEIVNFKIYLRNNSTANFLSSNIWIEINNPFVELLQNSSSLSSIMQNTSQASLNSFQIKIAGNTDKNKEIIAKIIIRDSNNVYWNTSFSLIISGQPDYEFSVLNYSIYKNTLNYINKIEFRVSLANIGNASAKSIILLIVNASDQTEFITKNLENLHPSQIVFFNISIVFSNLHLESSIILNFIFKFESTSHNISFPYKMDIINDETTTNETLNEFDFFSQELLDFKIPFLILIGFLMIMGMIGLLKPDLNKITFIDEFYRIIQIFYSIGAILFWIFYAGDYGILGVVILFLCLQYIISAFLLFKTPAVMSFTHYTGCLLWGTGWALIIPEYKILISIIVSIVTFSIIIACTNESENSAKVITFPFIVLYEIFSNILSLFQFMFMKVLGWKTLQKEKIEQEKRENEKIRAIPIIIPQEFVEIKFESPEIGLQIISTLQDLVEKALEYEQYVNALNLSEHIGGYYSHIINLFQQMEISSLIPTVQNEKEKNKLKIYQIQQIIFTIEYNQKAELIDQTQKNEDYSSLKDLITQIIGFLNNWLVKANLFEDTGEVLRISDLIKHYHQLNAQNNILIDYHNYRQKFEVLSQKTKDETYVFNQKSHNNALEELFLFKNELELWLKSDSLKNFENNLEKLHSSEEILHTVKELVKETNQLIIERIEGDLISTFDKCQSLYNIIIDDINKLDLSKASKNHQILSRKFQTFKNSVSKLDPQYQIKISIEKVINELNLKISQIENIIEELDTIHIYRELEEKLQNLATNLNQNNLTPSLQENQKIYLELEKFKDKLTNKTNKSKSDFQALSGITTLEEQSLSLKNVIEQQFKKIFSNQKIDSIVFKVKRAEIILPTLHNSNLEIKHNKGISHISNKKFKTSEDIPKLPIFKIKPPLHAKVVLIGESSVGKTHLVLSMTNTEYLPTQGSTIGVDKYYKAVNIPITNFDTQICFWDLGGQYNYRTINELFLYEASVILVVFDVTRPETFVSIPYWLDIINSIRGKNFRNIILVGNKIDVGGNAISQENLQNILINYDLNKKYLETSAKTGYNIKELSELIVGSIEWEKLVQNIEPSKFINASHILKSLKKQKLIISKEELHNELNHNQNMLDPLEVQAIITHYATQEIIIICNMNQHIILDPEYASKMIGTCIEMASRNNALMNEKDLKNWKYDEKQRKLFFEFLQIEQKCYQFEKEVWAFPNSNHRNLPELGEYEKRILESDPKISIIEFSGPGISIFTRIIIVVSTEWMKPIFQSDVCGLWSFGSGKEKTILLLQLIPTTIGGSIRIKIGGGDASQMSERITEIINQITNLFAKTN